MPDRLINKTIKEIIAEDGQWIEEYKNKTVIIKANYNRMGEVVDYVAQWKNEPLSAVVDENPNTAWKDLTNTY